MAMGSNSYGYGPYEVSAYDRPDVALANLIAGEPVASWQALLDPESLSPTERSRKIGYTLFPEAKKGKNPIMRLLADLSGNPLVWVGLLMSIRWPVVPAKDLFKVKPQFGGYTKAINPLLAKISTPETLFAGTKVPDIFRKFTFHTSDFLNKTLTLFGKPTAEWAKKHGRGLTREEGILVAAHLDREALSGFHKSVMGDAAKATGPLWTGKPLPDHLKELAVGYRKAYDEVFKILDVKSPRERNALLAALAAKKVHGINFRPGYYPHTLDPSSAMMMEQGLVGRLETESVSAARRRLLDEMSRGGPISGHLRPRAGEMIPSPEHMETLIKGGYVNPKAWEGTLTALHQQAEASRNLLWNTVSDTRLWAKTSKLSKGVHDVLKNVGYEKEESRVAAIHLRNLIHAGDGAGAKDFVNSLVSSTGNRAPYSLDLIPTTTKYISKLAPTWAFTVKGISAQLRDERIKFSTAKEVRVIGGKAVEMSPTPGGRQKLAILDDYYEMLRTGDIVKSSSRLWWNEMRFKSARWLAGPQAQKYLPEGTRKFLSDEANRSIMRSAEGIEDKVARYFYLTTLGFNPGSAAKNLLQVPITTGAMLGPGAYFEGAKNLQPKLRKYLELRFQKKMSVGDAMHEALPEFSKAGLSPAPLVEEEILHRMAREAGMTAGETKLRQVSDKFMDAAMKMFATTEFYNRALSFEMGLAHAAKSGMPGAAASDFAARVVGITQFGGGPLQTPYGLVRLAPRWRQFTTFPARFLEFIHLSTILGTGSENAPAAFMGSHRNWGTIGRMGVASAALYTAARDILKVDLGSGLVTGALPLPQYEESPFYPLPVVPPVLSIAGGAAMGLFKGDPKYLKDAATLVIPGGVQARRLVRSGLLSTGLPRYADYRTPAPDGSVPLYSEKGAFIGFRPRSDILKSLVGLRPMSAVNEPEVVGYLIKQRDKIREYRKQYVEAFSVNDMDRAHRIQEEFRRKYPELGPIQVKTSDLSALKRRYELSRIERTLQGMPKEYQGPFRALAASAVAGDGTGYSGEGGGEVPPAELQMMPPGGVGFDTLFHAPPTNYYAPPTSYY